MAVRGVPQQLSGLDDQYAFLRTGTVLGQVDPFAATVDVGGTAIRAAYIRQSPPVAGDVVAVLRQAATWFILGTSTASGANLVQNPSFEELDPATSDPLTWTLYDLTNVSSMNAVESTEAVDGAMVLQVTPASALTAASYVYSAPIGVIPGQEWQLSAYVNGFYPAAPPDTSDAQLIALWFADSADLYPTTSDPNSVLDTEANLPENDLMTLLTGTVTVPVNALFMRVCLRSNVDIGAGLHWDFSGARQVT